jgi:hypothetical protein
LMTRESQHPPKENPGYALAFVLIFCCFNDTWLSKESYYETTHLIVIIIVIC